jgi:hypothetical protein
MDYLYFAQGNLMSVLNGLATHGQSVARVHLFMASVDAAPSQVADHLPSEEGF